MDTNLTLHQRAPSAVGSSSTRDGLDLDGELAFRPRRVLAQWSNRRSSDKRGPGKIDRRIEIGWKRRFKSSAAKRVAFSARLEKHQEGQSYVVHLSSCLRPIPARYCFEHFTALHHEGRLQHDDRSKDNVGCLFGLRGGVGFGVGNA
jgi:hypothetical protein